MNKLMKRLSGVAGPVAIVVAGVLIAMKMPAWYAAVRAKLPGGAQ